MPTIDRVSYGEIVVDGKTCYSDLVVWWDGKKSLLPKTHLIGLPLIETLLKKNPNSIVIGTGIEGTVKFLPKVRQTLKKKKVSLFVDQSENAAEIFNGLISRGKKAVAVIHVTL